MLWLCTISNETLGYNILNIIVFSFFYFSYIVIVLETGRFYSTFLYGILQKIMFGFKFRSQGTAGKELLHFLQQR